jgi:hypothetical protein
MALSPPILVTPPSAVLWCSIAILHPLDRGISLSLGSAAGFEDDSVRLG